MKIYDITLSISEKLPSFPGDPHFKMERVAWIKEGRPYNLSHLSFGSHTGTHIDAPYHFIEEGVTVEDLPLEALIGAAWVFEVDREGAIGRQDLEGHCLKGKERILLKTRNSPLLKEGSFKTDYTYLSEEGARYLVETGVRLVGIDYFSIEQFGSKDFPTHHTLLRNGIIILEGVDLGEVPPGRYELICLPLRIKGGDGSPARVILREP